MGAEEKKIFRSWGVLNTYEGAIKWGKEKYKKACKNESF
jgi:hypothetical protein